jgi:hypothetical protein
MLPLSGLMTDSPIQSVRLMPARDALKDGASFPVGPLEGARPYRVPGLRELLRACRHAWMVDGGFLPKGL